MATSRNFLYRDMKCGRICLSHGGQLPVLHRRKGSQHFMNQAKFHSTFPILLLLKSLVQPSRRIHVGENRQTHRYPYSYSNFTSNLTMDFQRGNRIGLPIPIKRCDMSNHLATEKNHISLGMFHLIGETAFKVLT